MSYYAVITEVEFVIDKDNLDTTLQTLISFLTQYKNQYIYYYSQIENVSHCSELLTLFGFDCDVNDDCLSILSFDAKYGIQDHVMSSIAHLVKPASYILWRGEDDSEWGWLFDGSQFSELSPEKCINTMYQLKEKIDLIKKLDHDLPIHSINQNNKQKL